MTQPKAVSLPKKIIKLIVLGVILQSIVIIVFLNVLGIFENIKINSYETFIKNSSLRVDAIQKEMSSISNAVIFSAVNLNNNLTELANESHIAPVDISMHKDVLLEALDISLNSVSELFRQYSVTGGFCYFKNGEEWSKSYIDGIYVIDTSPENSDDLPNLSLVGGPKELLKNKNIHLSEEWIPKVDITRTDIHRGINGYFLNYTQESLNGVWTSPTMDLPENRKGLFFFVPLIDSDDNIYALYGIEIDKTFFRDYIIPEDETLFENTFYTLSYLNNSEIATRWIMSKNKSNEDLFDPSTNLKLDMIYDSTLNICKVKSPYNPDEMFVTYMTPLEFNSINSYVDEIKWWFVSFSPERELLKNANYSISITYSVTILSTLVCILFVIYTVNGCTRNIGKLSAQLSKMYPSSQIHLEKTNFIEIDELINSIESLHVSLLEYSSRVSKILDLPENPVGCFENDSVRDYVYITSSILRILNVKPKDGNYVNDDYVLMYKAQWDKLFNKIIKQPYEKMSNTYIWKLDDDAPTKWVRVECTFYGTSFIGIIYDVTDSVIKQQTLEFETRHDTITKLLKRTAFTSMAYHEIKNAPNSSGYMIFADIDNLKKINDKYGHSMGDRYIINAAKMLGSFRKIGGIVARMSGDEFALYIHNCEEKGLSLQKIMDFMEENRAETIFAPNGQEINVTFSMGLAQYPIDSKDVSTLIKFADFAMYEAKNNNKGGLAVFNKDFYLHNSPLNSKIKSFELLLQNRLLSFRFAPIYDIKLNKVYGYEAVSSPQLPEFQNYNDLINIAISSERQIELYDLGFEVAIKCIEDNVDKIDGSKILLKYVHSSFLDKDITSELKSNYLKFVDQLIYVFEREELEDTYVIEREIQAIKDNINANLAIGGFTSLTDTVNKALRFNPTILKVRKSYLKQISVYAELEDIYRNYISYCKSLNILILVEKINTYDEYVLASKFSADLVSGTFIGTPDYNISPLSPDKLAQLNNILKLNK